MKKANLAKWMGLWLLVAGLIMPSISIAKSYKTSLTTVSQKGRTVVFLFKNYHKDKDFQCSAQVKAVVEGEYGNTALHTMTVWDVQLPAGSLEIGIEASVDVLDTLKVKMNNPRIKKLIEGSDSHDCKHVPVYVTADKKIFRDRLKDSSLGPKMVRIPAGWFRMGDIQGSGRDDEKPVHWVSVNKFAMGKYEVTFAEYDKFANATGRKKPEDLGWGRGNRPVIWVSWYDAVAYTEWLSQQTGQQYRLPTEAEWEYAARAGTKTSRYWGNNPNKACNYANVYDNTSNKENGFPWEHHKCTDDYANTAPVGKFRANNFGLYDTIGNVWEWVADRWHKDYTNAPNDGRIWTDGANKNYRVRRGGSWSSIPIKPRAAYRGWFILDSNVNIGFRIVRRVVRTF
jgi:formylglycine-generating enzyme required for sulfatase activity